MPNLFMTPSGPPIDAVESGAWVQPFLHHHVLEVGAVAWDGLRRWGRGMVVCEAEVPRGRTIHWATEFVPHRLGYIPRDRVTAHLADLAVNTDVHAHAQSILETYDTTTELLALMLATSAPIIVLLRQMRIPPAECHRQWQHRSTEFCGVLR